MKNNIQKDRIKIFLVGDAIEYGRLISYRRGFEELYCRTKILDIRSYYKINIFNRIINIFRKIPIYFGVKKLNLAVLRDVLEFKPNFVLFFKPTLILPNVLFEIKKENIKIFSWCGDSVFFPKNLSGYFLKAIHLYDYHFTINFLNVGELLKKGARKSIFLPPAADSRIHYPTKPNPDEIKTIGADIVFVGTYEKDRAWHLEQLCKAGYNIKVYGNRWERCLKYSCLKRSGFITRNDVYCEDMSKVFNSSKIVLAFLRKHNRDSQTGRTYEIPACGAFMLHERTDEVKGIFQEGREAEFFGSFEELKKKIDFYLSHPFERKKIAKAGYDRIIKSDYFYKNRAEKILAVYNFL